MVLYSKKGFTLVELMIALAISSLLLASLYTFYTHQRKIHAVREAVAEMQQNARLGMAIMVREIRMAGYDPLSTAGAGIVTASSTSLQFTQDITDDSGTGDSDGDTDDANETISYTLYDADTDGDLDLGAGGTAVPITENIQSLSFTYILADGTSTGSPASLTEIRSIQVSLTARTSSPDPHYLDNGGYRTYTLTSLVTPRNLVYR